MLYMITNILILTFIRLLINYHIIASQLNFNWNWDILSRRIITLTLWITAIICICEKNYIIKLTIITSTLIALFTSKNIWFFFIYFEFSIIPILIIILLKGFQPERLNAGIRLLIYTFTARTILIFCILNLQIKFNSWNAIHISIQSWEIIILIIIAFLVKLPIWRIHIWLPKAHVEAPVGGSILLAAILLKLGVYGLYRLIIIRTPNIKLSTRIIISVGIIGILIRATARLFRTDSKVLIAYSSVSHISPILLLLLNFNDIAWTRTIILSVSHGFTSSIIFFTGNLIYKNSKTRLLIIQHGNIISNTIITLILFWRVIINLRTPPFLPFFSEITIFITLFIKTITTIPIIFLVVIISGIYNIYLFIIIGFGKEQSLNTNKVRLTEIIIFYIHIYPLLVTPFIC